MRRRRVLAGIGFLVWGSALAVLTLTPSGPPGPRSLGSFLCVWCLDRPAADLILNWLLFIPGGLFLRVLMGTGPTLAVGILITTGIETIQLLIPGRYPTLSDLLFNTAGMGTGVWLQIYGRRPGTLKAVAALAATCWLAPPLLLVPTPTEAVLFAQWTPHLAGLEAYDGAVLDARVAGIPTEFRLEASERVRQALDHREPVEVDFRVGTPPAALSPVYALQDENQVENLLVAVLGNDLLIRVRTAARVPGLDQPDMRWEDALASHAPGDTMRVYLHTRDGQRCLELDRELRCDIAPAAGEGYSFLLNLEGLRGGARLLLALLWSVALGLAFGVGWPRPQRAVVAAAALALAAWALATWSPDVRFDALHTTAFMTGAVVGSGLRALLPFPRFRRGNGKEGQRHHPVPGEQESPT